jgi:hypothetical protein
MMDMRILRQASWEAAGKLGFPTNETLPLLDNLTIARSSDEVVHRIFAMLCLAVSAYGFDRKKALAWLQREGSLALLTPPEREFLGGSLMNPRPFMEQIEAMWALCWCVRSVPDLDFSKPCSDNFVKLLPDLKKDESGAAFRGSASLRDSEEIVAKCDLAYCLHWGIVHAGLDGKFLKGVMPYLIIERRQALEWILSTDPWDEVFLDT